MTLAVPLQSMTAKDVMTNEILTVSADWSVEELARFLTDHCISGAPVVADGGRVVGVVSATDLVRHTSNASPKPALSAGFYADALLSRLGADELDFMGVQGDTAMNVRDIMTPVLFDVSEDASIQQVAEVMSRGHIHRVLVTRAGQVVGIISALDLVRVLRDLS